MTQTGIPLTNIVVLGVKKIYKDGKIRIPKEIREKMGLIAGDYLYIVMDDHERILLMKREGLEKNYGRYIVVG